MTHPSLPYAKISGCGNEFVMIDSRNPLFPSNNSSLIQKLCDRQLGLGADGVITLHRSAHADFQMRIFNADGSEANMCGNGLRCFGRFLEHIGFSPKKYQIEVGGQVLCLQFAEELIVTEIPLPTGKQKKNTLATPWGKIFLHCINTGVPHAVYLHEENPTLCFEDAAAFLQNHPFFGPAGTNVTFAKKQSDKAIAIRTMERGVGETAACGTGAAAAACVAFWQWALPSPLKVQMKGGDLTIFFEAIGKEIVTIGQRGPAKILSVGVW